MSSWERLLLFDRSVSRKSPSHLTQPTGAGLPELLITVAIVAVVTTASVPLFSTHFQSSALRAGAEELTTLLNLARSLAIKGNARVCVALDPGTNRVRLLLAGSGPCAAAVHVYGRQGHGFDARVDANGWMTLQNGVTVTAATADVVFTSLGSAAPGGTYTVAKTGRSLRVVVAPSGRVSVAP